MLTVVATNESNGIVTQITFSGAAPNDPDAIKRGDLIQFLTTPLAGIPFRYLQFIGRNLSQVPVQVRALSDHGSDGGGNVTVQLYPSLVSDPTNPDNNIPFSVQAGQQAGIPPTHKAGIIMSGKPFFFASPKLPDQTPYATAQISDPKTALTLRHYHGWDFANNLGLWVYDLIYGCTLTAEYSQRMLFPDTPFI